MAGDNPFAGVKYEPLDSYLKAGTGCVQEVDFDSTPAPKKIASFYLTEDHKRKLAKHVEALPLDVDQREVADSPREGVHRVLAGAGCLVGSSKIKMRRAGKTFEPTLEHAHKAFNGIKGVRYWDNTIPTYVKSLNEESGTLVSNLVEGIVYSGVKKVYKLTLEDGKFLSGTFDHCVYTRNGWKGLGSLTLEDEVAIDADSKHKKTSGGIFKDKTIDIELCVGLYHPYARPAHPERKTDNRKRHFLHRLIYEANLNGMSLQEFIEATKSPNSLRFLDPSLYVHHKDENHFNNDPSNLEPMTNIEHTNLHSLGWVNFKYGIPEFVRVSEVLYLGEENTYDIQCRSPHHSFVANRIVVHNSGKTFAIIARALNLLAHDPELQPKNIVLITFTNRAAGEIKTRFQAALCEVTGLEYPPMPFIGTIHSFAYNIIKANEGHNQTILSEYASLSLLRRTIRHELYPEQDKFDEATIRVIHEAMQKVIVNNELHFFVTPIWTEGKLKILSYRDPSWTSALLSRYEYLDASCRTILDNLVDGNHPELSPSLRASIRALYAQESGVTPGEFLAILKHVLTIRYTQRTFDFADLLYYPLVYLLNHLDALKNAQEKYQHIILDEAQDSDTLQFALMRLIYGQ